MTQEITEAQRIILRGLDFEPIATAQLEEMRSEDVIGLAQQMEQLVAAGLVDESGYPTADGVRAAWS